MDEVFIVQKRPMASETGCGFYFRIVNTETGVHLSTKFPNQLQADEECLRLNEEAAQTKHVLNLSLRR